MDPLRFDEWVTFIYLLVRKVTSSEMTETFGSLQEEIAGRKRVEEALRASEERSRVLFSRASDGIFIMSLDGKLIDINESFARMHGYSTAELLQMNIRDLDTPETSQMMSDRVARLMAGETLSFEVEHYHKDGHVFPLEVSTGLVSFGGQTYIQSFHRDITERKKAEEVQVFLAKTSSGEQGEPFFNALARYLAMSLGMDFVCIDRLEGDGLNAKTVAVWCDGHFEDNVTYALKDTPCGVLVGKDVCCYLANVCELFPRDQVLQDLQAASYIGVTLWSHSGKPIGLIAAIKRKPLVNRPLAEDTLKMVATRAAGELERLDAEEALRESEEEHRTILQAAMDGIWRADISGRLLEVNEAYCRMSGYSAQELKALCISDLVVAETADDTAARIKKIMTEDEARFESRHRRKDGSILDVEVSAQHRPTEGGRLVVFLHDITERKRAEEALKGHLTFQKGIIESAAEGICVCHDTPEHPYVKFTVWNSRMAEITGYTMEEINRLGWYQTVYHDPEVQERAKARMKRMRQGDNLKGEEWEITRSDGVRRVVAISTSVLQGIEGTVHVLGLFHDITERKRAEEVKRNLERQVQQAQKLESLGVLAGGIAHDFNNLLMVVLGHAELALNEISPMSAARGSLTEITTAARRAADLCRQMMAYAGKASFALERVGLRDLVEEMAHLLKTAISKKAILNLNLERGLPPIEADPSQVRQIVMNLIINASEAIGDQSGVITVSVGATRCDEEYLRKTELREDLAPGLYVHLEVTDTGSGIDAATRSRIFEPFFSTKFTGRGLGLAAVLGIVRAHKGALKLYSEPGKGTTFKVLFPALEEAGEGARTNGSPLADWRGKGTILLVDDEESLLALGARMLEHLGFTVLTAADGLQAVELYRERGKEIDLVLMDLTMPHMDGAEAFGELHRLNPDLRVVLASGYSHEDVASRFAGKSLAGVLQKPYTLAKLREALAGLLPKRPGGEG